MFDFMKYLTTRQNVALDYLYKYDCHWAPSCSTSYLWQHALCRCHTTPDTSVKLRRSSGLCVGLCQ